MKIRIFFSWQMTTDTKYNKYFILNCIKKAVKKVGNKPEFKEVEFEIQEGVTGEPGSVAVAATISNDRIPKCDIFIADLSVVNYTNKINRAIRKLSNDSYKPFQNNNVIYEYGIAYSNLGEEKIIGVLNSAYGSPNKNPSNIPFDIQHLRFPVQYSYSKKQKNKSKAQKQLIDGLADAIKTTALAALKSQKNKYRPFITWTEWENLVDPSQRFYSSDRTEEIKSIVVEAVKHPEHGIRFLGLSGLGKTRILLECFRPKEGDHESLLRSSKVLYINCNLYNEINFLALFDKLVTENENRVIILDNCSSSKHRSILQNIPSELSETLIISIDSNPEELNTDRITGVNYITLRKEELHTVVDQILTEDFSVLTEDNVNKIKEFSQGIPLMAVLIGESIKNGERFVGKLDDTDLLNKLLGQKAQDQRTRQLLKSCSIFNHFGFEEAVSSQSEFIATNKNITPIDGSDNVVINEFHELCEHYLTREIFERRGRFLSMRPFPLAMYLAQEWLRPCTPNRLMDVLTDIANLPDPDRKILSDSLAEQMKYLGYNDKAVSIVESIIGPGSPFDNAEVLNTNLGSRLFRSFVEVNPVAVADNLTRVISNLSDEELLEFKDGRRNIVWTLDKLCFDKRTFEQGIKLLFRFAISENEEWANNATSQLRHLFSVYLAGTESSLESRIKIIDWALNKQSDKYTQLALEAMDRGLDFGNFTRMGGAEKQGTKKLQDYEPSPKEIRDYWLDILKRLEQIIIKSEVFRERGTKILSGAIFSTFRAGVANITIPFVSNTAEILNYDWDTGLTSLKQAKKYDLEHLSKEDLLQINELITKLSKTDFVTRYKNFDSDFHLDNPGKYSSAKVKEGIIALAEEYVTKNISWEETLPELYDEPQAYAFYFGKRISELISSNPESIKKFIKMSVAILSIENQQQRNIMLFRGFASALDSEMKGLYYSTLEKHETLSFLIFQSVSDESNGKERLNYLFDLIDKGIGKVESFAAFNYGEAIQNMSYKELVNFSEKLFKFGKPGYRVLFEILFNLGYNEPTKRQEFKPLLKTCIENLWVSEYISMSNSGFKWSQTICEILESTDESEFASFINREVIDSIEIKNTYHLDHDMQRIYEVLISNHFSTIWPALSKALLGKEENYIKFYGLKHILGSRIGSISRKSGVIQKASIDEIFYWCEQNKPLAPSRLAELIPVYSDGNKDHSDWSPIAKRLIDEFGEYEEVLKHLSINMGSFSWTGSLVPLLNSKKALFEKLLNHNIEEVQKWAKYQVDNLSEQIKLETNRDQEMFL